MPKFPELDASLGETLDLPVPLPSGQVKTYRVLPVDAETWTWLTSRIMGSSDDEVVDDESELDLYKRWLGPVFDELVADKAGMDQIRRCGLTALSWHVYGAEAAMKVWVGGIPKRRLTSETSEPTETPAEAPSTPTPGSANGTTPTPSKTRSRGRPSSTAGRSSKSTSTRSTASTSEPPASSASAPATG